MRRVIPSVILLLFAVAPVIGQTLPDFPAYVVVPPAVHYLNTGNLEVVDYKTAEFDAAGGKTVKVSGKYYYNFINAEASLAGDWSNPAPVFNAIRQSLLANGWTVEVVDSPTDAVFRYRKPPINAWAELDVSDEHTSWLRVVEEAPQPVHLTLPAPASTPETINEDGDFPYLLHYPGAHFVDQQQHNDPLDVSTPEDTGEVLVGSGSIVKDYAIPDNVAPEQVLIVYDDALARAGWTLLEKTPAIVAHYTKNGRDIWLVMSVHDHSSFTVADVGSSLGPSALKTSLDAACHVPIYGVTFDTAKATLKPDATPVLQHVLAFLKAYPDLTVELQGHTDNVGTRASNQTLSAARADAVRAWLVAQGIAASRLQTKGYADTEPVASNDSDDGRAKNRRVEIAKIGCTPKSGGGA